MMAGKNWNPDNKYWGMTPNEIKAQWNASGAVASGAGTKLHDRIERFMNNGALFGGYTHGDLIAATMQQTDIRDDAPEWGFFLDFVRSHPEMKPYRTEWVVYSPNLKIAGSIDMVYENEDGSLAIYDWKRSKDIAKTNDWGRTATTPGATHIPDCNFWQYSLQLNLYRKIVELHYGKRVTKLCLVQLHPDHEEGRFELHEAPLMDDLMDTLLADRLSK